VHRAVEGALGVGSSRLEPPGIGRDEVGQHQLADACRGRVEGQVKRLVEQGVGRYRQRRRERAERRLAADWNVQWQRRPLDGTRAEPSVTR
jgi:hypothetical protein